LLRLKNQKKLIPPLLLRPRCGGREFDGGGDSFRLSTEELAAPTFRPTGHVVDCPLDFRCSVVSAAVGERERGEKGGKIVKRGFVDDGN
jgi:hypothetical protein